MTIDLISLHLLTANQRPHWAEKADKTRVIRAKAAAAWRVAGQPRLNHAHLTVTVTWPDRRTRDVENLAPTIKAAVDGMVHPRKDMRGILPDDSDHYLTGPDKRVNHDTVMPRTRLGHAQTRLTFTWTDTEGTPA